MSEFIKDDYFKIDPEPHIIGNMDLVNHFPGVQMWWRAIENIHRPMITGMPLSVYDGMEEWEMTKNTDPAFLLKAMDKYGVDIACLLPESKIGRASCRERV